MKRVSHTNMCRCSVPDFRYGDRYRAQKGHIFFQTFLIREAWTFSFSLNSSFCPRKLYHIKIPTYLGIETDANTNYTRNLLLMPLIICLKYFTPYKFKNFSLMTSVIITFIAEIKYIFKKTASSPVTRVFLLFLI